MSRTGKVGIVVATLFLVGALLFTSGMTQMATADDDRGGCPWTILGISVEKWGNGNIKRAMRARGTFPINIPGVTERPDWYVNGTNVGKADVFYELRKVYGGGYLIDKQQNTVMVKFTQPPYAGKSNSYSFYFDASKVPAGGNKWF